MQNFLIMFLLRSFTMTLLALFNIAITPLLLKRYHAKWCYYAWMIIIVSLIFPFRLHTNSSLVEIPLPAQEVADAAMEGFPASVASARNWMESVTRSPSSFSVWEMLTVVWFLGTIALFACYVTRHCRFMSMVRRWSEEITDSQTLKAFCDVEKQVGIREKVGIRKCSCVYTPMLIGLIRPSIVLPDVIYTPEELTIILKHELIHFKRRDLWYRVLVIAARSIHWFNPFLPFIAKEIAALCELSCDEEVVKDADFNLRKQYSKIIFSSLKKIQPQTAFSTDFGGGQRNVRMRITWIMDITKKKTGFAMVCVLLIIVLGASSVFSISETPVNYIDKTFMKKRIMSGAALGGFSSDRYIIYPEGANMGNMPSESVESRDAYSDTAPDGTAFIELRYRYPFEIIQKDETGKEYATRVFFDYDYVLSDSIEYQELNYLIGSYLKTFKTIFKDASFEELIHEDGIYSMLKRCKEYVDNNTDSRVRFRFYLSGIGGDAPIEGIQHERINELNTFN